jgi:hypothetical protein
VLGETQCLLGREHASLEEPQRRPSLCPGTMQQNLQEQLDLDLSRKLTSLGSCFTVKFLGRYMRVISIFPVSGKVTANWKDHTHRLDGPCPSIPIAERAIEIERGADQCKVCEGLWKVSECLSLRADLFCEQPEVVGVSQHAFKDQPGLI